MIVRMAWLDPERTKRELRASGYWWIAIGVRCPSHGFHIDAIDEDRGLYRCLVIAPIGIHPMPPLAFDVTRGVAYLYGS